MGTIVGIGSLALLGLYFLPRVAGWYDGYSGDMQIAARSAQREELARKATEARHAAAVAALTPADRAALLQIVRDYYAAHAGWKLPAPQPTGIKDGDNEWIIDFDGQPGIPHVGGPGVSVHIDKKSRSVTRVLGWQ